MTLLFMLVLQSLLRFVFWVGWLVPAWLGWLLRPSYWALSASLVLATFAPGQVSAGWLWDTQPDPKIEAANQALEHAAQLATEAARTQSSQQAKLLQAVEALSNERTQLAGHLQHLSDMANRDSAWAAALNTTGPVLISAGVLLVAAMAIWMHVRASSHDAQLASVLVEEVAGTGTGFLIRHPSRGSLPALGHDQHTRNSLESQEMPF